MASLRHAAARAAIIVLLAPAGALKGGRWRPLPTRRAYWYALALAIPNIELYQPKGRR